MTPDQITAICNQLAEGKSLRAICREQGLAESSIRYWLMKDSESFAQTAHARELGCDAMADECVEIADSKELDPADRRVRIETRLKLIGKWSQRYSDKLAITNKTEVTHRYELDGLSPDELDTLERIAEKAANAGGDTRGSGETVAPAVH